MKQSESPLWGTLRSLALVVERQLHDEINRQGVTVAQYSALRAYADNPGISSAEMARICNVTAQTAQTTTVALVAKGMLERSSIPGTGRAMVTRVTPRGRRALLRVVPVIAALEATLGGFVGPEFKEQAEILLLTLSVWGSGEPEPEERDADPDDI